MKGRCPRCGQGRLFAGWLAFADACEACGLDYDTEDAGDGPAFFVLTACCFVLVPLALVFHFTTGENIILTMAVMGSLIVGVSVGLLRPLRGWMYGQQVKTRMLRGDDP